MLVLLRIASAFPLGLLLLLLSTLAPVPLTAQSGPEVTITPAGGAVQGTRLEVEIHWESSTTHLDYDTRRITWNGREMSEAFSHSASVSRGTVRIQSGTNRLYGFICDTEGFCGSASERYIYDTTSPTVEITPASGPRSDRSVVVRIEWHDAVELDRSSYRVELNGRNVTGSFGYSGSSTSAESHGRIQLEAGLDRSVLEAHICDAVGNCRGRQAWYSYDASRPEVAISPPSKRVTTGTLPVRIHWTDDGVLEKGSRVIRLNGKSVVGQLSYEAAHAGSATSAGRLHLRSGTNTLEAKICDRAGRCSLTRRRRYVFPEKAAPVLSTGPHNGELYSTALCAADCFDAVVRYTTPAYVSRDVPRSVTLLYRSARAHPVVRVQVNVRDTSLTTPEKLSIRLEDAHGGWVTFLNGRREIFYDAAQGTSRLALAFDASRLATSASRYTVVVRSWWPDGTMKESTAPVRILHVSAQDSPFGAGWSLAGRQRLVHVQGSILIVQGDGSAAFFRRTRCDRFVCRYASPPGDFTTLKRVQHRRLDGSVLRTYYVRHYPDDSRVFFSPLGRDSVAQDAFGNKTRYHYTQAGRLVRITDPAGKAIRFGYGTDGKLAWIESADGRRTTITINEAGNLTRIRDPGGRDALRASYDGKHRMRRWIDRRGGSWSFSYSSTSKLDTHTLPAVAVADRSTRVRPRVRYRSAVDAVLAAVASGQGTAANPAPRRSPWQAQARITGPLGRRTSLVLDHFGAPTWIREPLGRTRRSFRNRYGQDTLTIRPSGQKIWREWDGPHLIRVSEQLPGGLKRTIHFDYTPQGHLQHVSGDVTAVWHYWSGPWGARLDSTRIGSRTAPPNRYSYDAHGRIRSVRDPEGHTTRYTYQRGGWQNTASVSAPGHRTTRFGYDRAGRLATRTGPLGHSTTIHYDALGRTVRTIGPTRDTTRYRYDALYRTAVTDAKGQTIRFRPNALGWVQQRIDPRGRSDTYSYNVAGQLLTHTNRRGQRVRYRYDKLGQLTRRIAGGDTTYFRTDPQGRFTAAWNRTSRDTLRFDLAGRLTRASTRRGQNRYLVEYRYTSRGLQRWLGYRINGKRKRSATYTYNAFQQLSGLPEFGSARRTQLRYNHDRQATSYALDSGLTMTKTYPSTHRTGLIHYSTSALNSVLGAGYRQNKRRLISERTTAMGDTVRRYSYDAHGRLTGYQDSRYFYDGPRTCGFRLDEGFVCTPRTRQVLGSERYRYDKLGNRTDRGARVATGNRLTAFAGFRMSYDAAGHLIRKWKPAGTFNQRLWWNTLGQLVRVETTTNSGTTTVRFGYDAFGRRAWRRQDNRRTLHSIWDGDDVLLVTNGAGTLLVEYNHYPGTDRPHSVRLEGDNDQVYYYATDFPGNVVGLINRQGQLVNHYRYSSWGVPRHTRERVPSTLRFMARHYDATTGLYYMRARYYDPQLARFISEDPIGLAGGINPYVFAGNNPVTFRDPTGLTHICDTHVDKSGAAEIICYKERGHGDADEGNFPPRDGWRPAAGGRSRGPGAFGGPSGPVQGEALLCSITPTCRPSHLKGGTFIPLFRKLAPDLEKECTVQEVTNMALTSAIRGAAIGAARGAAAGAAGGLAVGGLLGVTTGGVLAPATGAAGGVAGGWIGGYAGGSIGLVTGFAASAVTGTGVALIRACYIGF